MNSPATANPLNITNHDMGTSQSTQGVQQSTHSGVERIVGEVIWDSPTTGFLQCPGEHQHTTPSGKRDCRIYMEPVIALNCFHSGCNDLVRSVEQQLRRGGIAGGSVTKTSSAERKLLAVREKEKEALRMRAANSTAKILKEYRWECDDMRRDSPNPVPDTPLEHSQLILECFEPDDVIWIGDLFDSGKENHVRNFKTKSEWREDGSKKGQFTCPSTFRPGSFSRSLANVSDRRFLVVESDTLDKNTVGGVFRWLKNAAGLNLRCIVDTGGKSLHAWFNYPAEDELRDLQIVLPALGCDPKMFNPAQPCRFPGAMRGQTMQAVVYFDGGAQ